MLYATLDFKKGKLSWVGLSLSGKSLKGTIKSQKKEIKTREEFNVREILHYSL